MIYFLDSSCIIDYLKEKEPIVNFISSRPDDDFITSSLCEAEVNVGIFRLKGEKRMKMKSKVDDTFKAFDEVVSFSSEQAQIFGEIKAELMDEGRLIEDMDILIAAVAISRNATLLTGNPKHFSRVKNLRIEKV